MDGNQKRLKKAMDAGDKDIGTCECGRYFKLKVIKHWPHHKTVREFDECLACRGKNENTNNDCPVMSTVS